uniref:SLC26A/SulP transporter domain-containing protein n=1 Tax=Anopheles maculatus TaxID=74869 RepID=A0A182T6N3_9DIPT
MRSTPRNSNGVANPSYSRDSSDTPAERTGGRRSKSKISQVIVARPHYQQEDLNNAFNYFKPKSNFYQEAMESMREMDTKTCLTGLFPIFQWLPEYSFPSDFIGDLISGLTVGVMHIPQGMGYALIANMPPITGIYTAFFPVFIYFLLGTSRHNSMALVSGFTTGAAVYVFTSQMKDILGVTLPPLGSRFEIVH